MPPKRTSEVTKVKDSTEDDPTKIKIVVKGCDHNLFFAFKPKTKLMKVMTMFSQTSDIPVKYLKFLFDGVEIKPSQTAEQIGLGSADVIEVIRRPDGGAYQ